VTSLPGATLDEADGDAFRGRMAVKLGPMSLTYAGEGTLVAVPAERQITITGSGAEQRGGGSAAAAVITLLLAPVGAGATKVETVIDLDLAGKPAQFGRGILAGVVSGLAATFAKKLEGQLSVPATAGGAGEAERSQLDLGAAVLRRVGPPAAALAIGACLGWLLRGRIARAGRGVAARG
jgi:carbon monoxide dehydrogenase subunit G